jgi:hypothetical protein
MRSCLRADITNCMCCCCCCYNIISSSCHHGMTSHDDHQILLAVILGRFHHPHHHTHYPIHQAGGVQSERRRIRIWDALLNAAHSGSHPHHRHRCHCRRLRMAMMMMLRPRRRRRRRRRRVMESGCIISPDQGTAQPRTLARTHATPDGLIIPAQPSPTLQHNTTHCNT